MGFMEALFGRNEKRGDRATESVEPASSTRMIRHDPQFAVLHELTEYLKQTLETVRADNATWKKMFEQERETVLRLQSMMRELEAKVRDGNVRARETMRMDRPPVADPEPLSIVTEASEYLPIPVRILNFLGRVKRPATIDEVSGNIHRSHSRTNDYLLLLLKKGAITRVQAGKRMVYSLAESVRHQQEGGKTAATEV